MPDYFWGGVNMAINTVISLPLAYTPFRHKLKVTAAKAFIFNSLAYALFVAAYILLAPNYLSFSFLQTYKLAFIFPGSFIAFNIIEGSNFKIFYFILMTITYIVVSAKLSNFFIFRIYENPSHFALAIANLCVFAVTLPPMVLYLDWIFRLTDKLFETSDVWKNIWLVPMLFLLLCLSSNLKFDPAIIREPQFMITNLLTVAGMMISTSALIRILKQAAENAALKETARMTENQLYLQREQYELMAENAETVKAQRHDLRHQLAVIKSYNNSGEKEKLNAYLEELTAGIPSGGERMLCENFAVNAVALHYVSIAESEMIKTYVHLLVPKKIGRVKDSDLSVIIGNFLENAIEACKQVEEGERFIKLRSRILNDMLVITMDNSFDGYYNERDETFYSRKRDGRGIGLSSALAVSKKYGGDARFEVRGNVFLSSVYVIISEPQIPSEGQAGH